MTRRSDAIHLAFSTFFTVSEIWTVFQSHPESPGHTYLFLFSNSRNSSTVISFIWPNRSTGVM